LPPGTPGADGESNPEYAKDLRSGFFLGPGREEEARANTHPPRVAGAVPGLKKNTPGPGTAHPEVIGDDNLGQTLCLVSGGKMMVPEDLKREEEGKHLRFELQIEIKIPLAKEQMKRTASFTSLSPPEGSTVES